MEPLLSPPEVYHMVEGEDINQHYTSKCPVSTVTSALNDVHCAMMRPYKRGFFFF